MAWTIEDRFPDWGETGEFPTDGFFYEGGDQVNEKHLDALWNGVKMFEDEVRSALSDIDNDGDGVVDDSDQYDGTAPSDGDDEQFLQTDGTTTSWGSPTIVSDSSPSVAAAGRSWVRLNDRGTEVFSEATIGEVNDVTVEDGILYICTGGSTVEPVDALDQSSAGSSFNINETPTSIDAQGNNVYVGDDVGDLQLYDGSYVWEHSEHNAEVTSVAAHGDTIYSGDSDGTVVATDASDGSVLWTYTGHSGDQISAVSPDREFIWVLSDSPFDNNISRVDKNGGTNPTTYTIDPGSSFIVDGEVDDGVVYFVGEGGGNQGDPSVESYYVGGSSPVELWSHVLGGQGSSSNEAELHLGEDRVYTTTDDGIDMDAFDRESGENIWNASSPGNQTALYEENGLLYVGQGDGYVDVFVSDQVRYTSDGDEWLFESRLR